MYPRIMHIYGPFCVQSYGVMIVLGFSMFLLCTFYNKKRREIICDDQYLNTMIIGLISGLIGGRAFFVFYEWSSFAKNWLNIFRVWDGGFVILGSILGVLLTLSIYLWWIEVAIFKYFDLIAIYVPIVQAFGRIGCFLAGCCYGVECYDNLFAVIFTNTNSIAPLNVPLYPTQLYLSVTSLLIFVALFLLRNVLNKNGQITFAYLCFDSLARFFIDFYRGDRGDLTHFNFLNCDFLLSGIQVSVLVVLIGAMGAFFAVSLYHKKKQ